MQAAAGQDPAYPDSNQNQFECLLLVGPTAGWPQQLKSVALMSHVHH